ncbi:MAG: hypothetical protein N3B18_12200 [Desulfobacterota bacterium]|nr:hypothetical protein [Thermodesulfobacteriota bacterium]
MTMYMQEAYHPIHLCQPDCSKSCGACCGLYNWHDHSRSTLTALLSLQTELLAVHLPRNSIEAYRSERELRIESTKLCSDIYNCEFLGFIDPERKRVGCLAHPKVNNGNDLRDLCLYGRDICQNHFCPGYSCLTTIEQKAVIYSIDDWYLYGLIITDIDLVKEFFRQVENRIGDSIRERNLMHPAALKALRDFFLLKEHWPFKAAAPRLGKYFFTATEYTIARIDYQKRWGIPGSQYDKILVSLESDFSNREELHASERMIEEKINAFIAAYIAQQKLHSYG